MEYTVHEFTDIDFPQQYKPTRAGSSTRIVLPYHIHDSVYWVGHARKFMIYDFNDMKIIKQVDNTDKFITRDEYIESEPNKYRDAYFFYVFGKCIVMYIEAEKVSVHVWYPYESIICEFPIKTQNIYELNDYFVNVIKKSDDYMLISYDANKLHYCNLYNYDFTLCMETNLYMIDCTDRQIFIFKTNRKP